MTSSTRRIASRRVALLAALAGLVFLLGCGSNGLGTDSLVPSATRAVSAMDGFVFVPSRSRQTATGNTIPHALIAVYVLPRTPDSVPIATGQADETGFYRIEGLQIHVPLLVVATDPFSLPGQPVRQLTGLLSFGAEGEERRRNLTDTSTLAANIAEQRGITQPVTDAQVAQLEALAEQRLSDPAHAGQDVTADRDLLDQLTVELATESFGAIDVRVTSRPQTEARIYLNGGLAGRIRTGPVDAVVTRQAEGELHIDDVIVGQAVVRIEARGFLTDEVIVDVVGNQTVLVERQLVPEPTGDNPLPVIQSVRVQPDVLPFQGGTVSLQAVARDPLGEALTARAVIIRGGAAPVGRQAGLFATIDLTAGANNTYTGEVTVPGNPEIFNQAYLVQFEVTDGPDRPVVRRVKTFSVAAVNVPPQPPAGGGDAAARQAFAHRLNGQFHQWTTGPGDAQEPSEGLVGVLTFESAPSRQIPTNGTYEALVGEALASGSFAVTVVRGNSATVLLTGAANGGIDSMPGAGEQSMVTMALSDSDRTLWIGAGNPPDEVELAVFRRAGTTVPYNPSTDVLTPVLAGLWLLTGAAVDGPPQPVPSGTTLRFDQLPPQPVRGFIPTGAFTYEEPSGTATGTYMVVGVGQTAAILLLQIEDEDGDIPGLEAGDISAGEFTLSNGGTRLTMVAMQADGLLHIQQFDRPVD